MDPYRTKYFHQSNEVDVWNTHAQQWTGRVSASSIWNNPQIMDTLNDSERMRIARMAARRGNRAAASWWASRATRPDDKREARMAVNGYR